MSNEQNDTAIPRVHFIAEWAAKFDLSGADIEREVGADKSTVSRWFNKGIVPTPVYLERLAALFQMDGDLTALFRHPDDDWLKKLFSDKSEAEKKRAIELLEAHWKKIA